MLTVACTVPLGTAVVYHDALPPYANSLPELVKTVAVVTLEAQTRLLLCTAHFPLLDVNVNPLPEAVAVKPAHVPPMYHVPPLIIQPLLFPPDVTSSVPFPEKGVPGAGVGVPAGGLVVVVSVVAGGVEPDFGRYFTPVAGQSDLEPSRGETPI